MRPPSFAIVVVLTASCSVISDNGVIFMGDGASHCGNTYKVPLNIQSHREIGENGSLSTSCTLTAYTEKGHGILMVVNFINIKATGADNCTHFLKVTRSLKTGKTESQVLCGARKDFREASYTNKITLTLVTNGVVQRPAFALKLIKFKPKGDSATCPRGTVSCDFDRCLEKRYTCDSVNHCTDASDEDKSRCGHGVPIVKEKEATEKLILGIPSTSFIAACVGVVGTAIFILCMALLHNQQQAKARKRQQDTESQSLNSLSATHDDNREQSRGDIRQSSRRLCQQLTPHNTINDQQHRCSSLTIGHPELEGWNTPHCVHITPEDLDTAHSVHITPDNNLHKRSDHPPTKVHSFNRKETQWSSNLSGNTDTRSVNSILGYHNNSKQRTRDLFTQHSQQSTRSLGSTRSIPLPTLNWSLEPQHGLATRDFMNRSTQDIIKGGNKSQITKLRDLVHFNLYDVRTPPPESKTTLKSCSSLQQQQQQHQQQQHQQQQQNSHES